MRTDILVENEIRRISEEIKETCRSDGDADKEGLVRDAVRKYGLTLEERDFLRDLVRF